MATLSNSSVGGGTGGTGLVFRPVTAAEVPWAVGLILGAGGAMAPTGHVAEFLRYSTERHINISEIQVAEQNGKLIWAVLPMISPGRTALLFSPAESVPGDEEGRDLIEHICANLKERGIVLAQTLIDPAKMAARQFYKEAGFRELAELIYLNGHVSRAARAPVLTPPMRLENYSAENHRLFAAAIQASYANSLDCPGLTGLRDIEDVIEGHRATGQFDPELWHVLMRGQEPAGVLLLSRIAATDALELVYLGLAAWARGQGLGDLLMQQATNQVIRTDRRRLSLAVDQTNTPALKLYYRYGMARLTSKVAMLRDLRTSSAC